MRRRNHGAVVIGIALLALMTVSVAAQVAAAAPAIDPDAIEALKKMGAYLNSLKAFRVQSATTRDEVLETGENIQYSGTTDMLAQRPNRLRLDVKSDRKARMWFYDGKSFTLYSPRTGYYATVSAPATIGQLADDLQEKYGLPMPLVDLFDWGTDKADIGAIKSATDIGPSAVEGTDCEHYAFRQEGLDWQIWIQQGPNPLPRKLVLTTLTDDARPQYSAVMTWDLAPAYNDQAFVFSPPKGSQKIVFAKSQGSE